MYNLRKYTSYIAPNASLGNLIVSSVIMLDSELYVFSFYHQAIYGIAITFTMCFRHVRLPFLFLPGLAFLAVFTLLVTG